MGERDQVAATATNVGALQRLDAAFAAADFSTLRDALASNRLTDASLPADVTKLFALMFDVVDPGVVVDLSEYPGGFVGGNRWEGLGGWTAFWREWLSPWSEFRYEVGNAEEVGDHVIRQVTISARGADSGAPVDWSHVQLWSFRDGKIVGVRVFESRERAHRWIERAE
jgi:hypothetical protein